MVWKLSQSLPAEQSKAVEGLCGQLASAALRVPFFGFRETCLMVTRAKVTTRSKSGDEKPML